MRTPDGVWTVEVIRTRGGQVFRVRWRAVIGGHGGSGWSPIRRLGFSIEEVAELLGEAFGDLVEDSS